jgi:hypothetical protein
LGLDWSVCDQSPSHEKRIRERIRDVKRGEEREGQRNMYKILVWG